MGVHPCLLGMVVAGLLAGTAVCAQEPTPRRADFAGQSASADAHYVAQWALDHADNRQLPYVVVDKRDARMFIFNPSGQLLGSTPVLTGLAVGDHAAADVALREPSDLRPHERTTPAGRYVSEPGRNLGGEDIVWLDYAAKLAIHRVRADSSEAQRLLRLASPTPEDNRISLGCVVVPVAFYERLVRPVLGKSLAVVYILPDGQPAREVFHRAPAASYAQR
ncbi:MAG: hypothetical protein V4562_02635 [Pseudomonadota bacterium]